MLEIACGIQSSIITVANAGDCRAVLGTHSAAREQPAESGIDNEGEAQLPLRLCRSGKAVDLSEDLSHALSVRVSPVNA